MSHQNVFRFNQEDGVRRYCRHPVVALCFMVLVHVGLLIWTAWQTSPVSVEIASLPAGLRTLRLREFSLFRVNPPLVRCWAAAASIWLDPKLPDWEPVDGYLHRSEFDYGAEFVQVNTEHRRDLFRVARLACVPFSLVGMVVCYLWAAERADPLAGLLSACIWCFSPVIIGHGSLVTNDVPAASTGVLACYLFDRWLRNRRPAAALAAAFALGIALLTKLTLILLPATWLIVLLIVNWLERSLPETNGRFEVARSTPKANWGTFFFIFELGLTVMNIGYACRGVGRSLGSFEFTSRLLAGEEAAVEHRFGIGNRFRGTTFEKIRVPLPEDYVIGLDQQRRDLEAGRRCFLAGRWRQPPTPDFYLYAFFVKLPCGTLLLALAAVVVCFLSCTEALRKKKLKQLVLLNCPLILPPAAFFVLLSSQNSAGGHFRYALICLPFFFVAIAVAVTQHCCRKRIGDFLVAAAFIATAVESICAMPNSLGFFNAAVGGSGAAPNCLLGTDADWGQDLDRLAKWWNEEKRQQPEPLQLFVDCSTELPLQVFFGSQMADVVDMSKSKYIQQSAPSKETASLPPGTYAISLNNLYGQPDVYKNLRAVSAAKVIGNSIYVFRITKKIPLTTLP